MIPHPHVEPRLGRVHVAYADPWAGHWAYIALGGALFAAGVIVSPLAVASLVTPHRHESTGDAVGLLVFGAALLFGGLALMVWSIRERVRQPALYVCEHGMAKISTKGSVWTAYWQELDRVEVVRLVRTGQVVGFYVRLNNKRLVFAPSEDVARLAQSLWAATNAAAGLVRATVA